MTLEGQTFERNADERGRISLPTSKAKNKRLKIEVIEEVDYREKIDSNNLEYWKIEDPNNGIPLFSAHYTEDKHTYLMIHGDEGDFSVEIQIGKSGAPIYLPGDFNDAEDAVRVAKEWMIENDRGNLAE